ncbi:hypothetical protein AB0P40_26860, partial [Streptomyces sp. NPDC079189]|uniref:hypothetical protein n=1 Tax=Streptomyces sp. NPDC079189 TaxID=3154514 RepID=UPI00341AAA0F
TARLVTTLNPVTTARLVTTLNPVTTARLVTTALRTHGQLVVAISLTCFMLVLPPPLPLR